MPALPKRDAVLPMLALLVAAKQRGLSLSALRAELLAPFAFSERLLDYPSSESQALLARLREGSSSYVLERLTAMFGDLAARQAPPTPRTIFG